jgi:colicin import membrane protein
MVGWSAVAHVCALALALISPRSSSNFDVVPVVSVDLVALPAPARAASRPPPKAAAPPQAPAEKPPPPKPKQVVLPKNAEKDPVKAKPRPKEATPEPQPREEKELEDLLAEMREEAGEPTPAEAPPTTVAAPTGVPNAGAGVRVSPEVMAWMRKAKIHVRSAWVVPPGFRDQALETRVVVELDAAGAVVGQPRIVRRSGNPWFDEGVVRGIEKSSPLPPPPRAGEWDFVFLPEDAY